MTDAQVIGTWQQFRKAIGSVNAALSASLIATDSPKALVHEALTTLAVAPDHMLPMSDLARTLGLSSAAATRLVDRLLYLGLAYRHHSSLDRHIIFAALTDAGVTREQDSTPHYATGLRSELALLGSERITALREICAMIEHRQSRPATSVDMSAATALFAPRRGF